MYDERKPGDYGYRRRRNIILPSDKNEEVAAGIKWPNAHPEDEPDCDEEELNGYDDKLEYAYEEYEVDPDPEMGEADNAGKTIKPMMIGNKPINLAKFMVKKQEPSVEKLTIYLDKNLISVLKILKQNKSINSYSDCIARALETYLTGD